MHSRDSFGCQPRFCLSSKAAIGRVSECRPLAVSGHSNRICECSLYPRKQILLTVMGMSALCHKRTLRAAAIVLAAIARIGEFGFDLQHDSVCERFQKSAASATLLFLHARSDGLDNHRSHLEGIPAIFDVVPASNPIEISIDGPDITIRILMNQQSHRPVQARIRI